MTYTEVDPLLPIEEEFDKYEGTQHTWWKHIGFREKPGTSPTLIGADEYYGVTQQHILSFNMEWARSHDEAYEIFRDKE